MAIAPENMDMETTENETSWTSEKFIALKKDFLETKSEIAAFDILQRLIYVDPNAVDDNAWLDCKNLIVLLLENIPAETMLLRQQMLLLQAVNSSPPHVISTLADFYSGNAKALVLLREQAVAVAVAFARRINHTGTFEAVAKLLAPLASQQEVRRELFHQLSSPNNSEHRFRVYEVLLETLRQHTYQESLFEFFDFIADELKRNDVLVQLTAMDFLSDLAIISKEGAQLLNNSGIISAIESILKHGSDSPDGGFLHSAAVKFFGCLAHCYPEIIDSFPEFMSTVMQMLYNFDCLDASQRVLSVETFSHLVFTVEAKKKLENLKDSSLLRDALDALCSATRSGPVELRSRVIDAFSIIFENVEDTQLTLWLAWTPGLSSILTTYVTRPFPEIRLSSIRLLKTLFSHGSGVNFMFAPRENIEQFKEWLCDPQSENEWEACQLKNSLIHDFRLANWTGVDESIKNNLKHYFDSPKRAPEVATLEL